MPFLTYEPKRFRASTLEVIDTAVEIISEYSAQGFDLTLRQLYYQFVARGLLANDNKEYKRLGGYISDARMAGLVDWSSIVDRTRTLRRNSHWSSPGEIVETCAYSFQYDKWKPQPYRPEVWIEKDALVGVLESVCSGLDVSYFSCRGYSSQSAMWRAARRLVSYETNGQMTVVFHLGDHDPSGIDMTRDIRARLRTFGANTRVERLALNMGQVEEHGPPPNPAKMSDTRAADYIRDYGTESWELDALDPRTISDLIRKAVIRERDGQLWNEETERESAARQQLREVSDNWDEVVSMWDSR
jgi:hypothetical protein